jgi:hypothetical protein
MLLYDILLRKPNVKLHLIRSLLYRRLLTPGFLLTTQHSLLYSNILLIPASACKNSPNSRIRTCAPRRRLKPPLLHSLKEVVSPALKKKFSFSYTSHIPTFFRPFSGFFHAHSLHCYTSSLGKIAKSIFMLALLLYVFQLKLLISRRNRRLLTPGFHVISYHFYL